jgi:oligopeptide/dipeptide ABC transporter ATP-binding protein
MTALLEARGVTQVFGNPAKGGVVALDNLTLAIDDDAPSFTAVVGESGSGKTTLARILLGFQSPSRGEVRYRGVDLSRAPTGVQHEFRREVQAIFQDPFAVYNPFYKVDHLLLAPIRNFGLARSTAHARDLIAGALSAVGLRPEETLGRYPHQLSGGQRQRITVARALLLKPRLIIADEPVSMVDASLRATILESLRTLNLEYGISFIYITHDLTTAYQVSDNVMVLYRGTVAEAGAAATVIKQPQHPYTQLLVASIPLPDPEHRWGEHVALARDDGQRGAYGGCPFADRCPFVMPVCRESPPPLFRTDRHQAASCFLHRESPALGAGEDIATVFQRRAATPRQEGTGTG